MMKSACAIVTSLAILSGLSCFRDSYWVKLSGPVDIGEQWVELRPELPLRAEKDFQFVVLDLEAPSRYDLLKEGKGPNAGKGILMPDGEVNNPEIELVDEHGNTFNLVWRGARGPEPSPAYRLSYPHELPRDREYKYVRIRSPRPIKCKAVYWFCDSAQDWK